MSSHYVPHTKVPTLVFPTSVQAARHVALMIEALIRQNNSTGRNTVLGLATGSTPVGLYRELIRLHKEAGLDFARVVTFNLPPHNVHIPDGTLRPEQVEDFCTQYEQLIRRAGGIDLQILGIGRTGH